MLSSSKQVIIYSTKQLNKEQRIPHSLFSYCFPASESTPLMVQDWLLSLWYTLFKWLAKAVSLCVEHSGMDSLLHLLAILFFNSSFCISSSWLTSLCADLASIFVFCLISLQFLQQLLLPDVGTLSYYFCCQSGQLCIEDSIGPTYYSCNAFHWGYLQSSIPTAPKRTRGPTITQPNDSEILTLTGH